MKQLILIFTIGIILLGNVPGFAHKPISSDGSNVNYENALLIPDHKISWAIYEELEKSQTKFYMFDAKAGDSFYSSIVIPKLDRFENYKPGLALISEQIEVNAIHNINSDLPPGGIIVYNYDGQIPSSEFYEPFTQTNYWERQEVKITIPTDGTYYIAVFDNQEMKGKYSLAVGTIEDFSFIDFFTILPLAWFSTKLFFEDYLAFGIASSIAMAIAYAIIISILKKSGLVHSFTIIPRKHSNG